MLHHRWSSVTIKIVVIIGFILNLACCAKQPSKTVVVDQSSDVKQDVVLEKKAEAQKSTVIEQPPTSEKTFMAEEKQITEAAPVIEKKADVKKRAALRTQHIVKKGESLWWIAKYKDQYNDPYLWPLIYKANKNRIKNPDIIYPGQKFNIPRAGYKLDDIKKARIKAGAPNGCQMPKNANLPVD